MDKNENKSSLDAIQEELEKEIKHWWVFLILGLLAGGIGIWLFFTPENGFLALSLIFAIGFFFSGVSTCTVSFVNRKSMPFWGLHLAMGVFILIMSIMMLTNIGMSESILVYYVSFAIMFNGFNSIGFSFTMKSKGNKAWGWTLALGLLVVLLSASLMLHPIFAALTIVIWTGITFLSMGICFCILGYHLSKTKGDTK